MPTIRRLVIATTIALSLALVACGDDGPDAPSGGTSRAVRYELSGTYTRPLTVVYTTATGGSAVIEVPSLPWSRDVTYERVVPGLGLAVQSVSANASGVGQIVTARVLAGGQQVRIAADTADANGLVILPSLTYVFP